MNTWPVELISYVFELACTGDGQTVRALSLTSKQFLEIARPYLYQSLVLSTRGHLITLLNRLKNIPSHLRRIRHLFLAPRHDLHSHHHCDSDALLVTKLLRIAAEHLQSLTLITPCPHRGTLLLSYLFRISFPQLEELSIAGLYAFSFQSGNFPHLRRLHFAAGNRNPSGLFQFGALDKAFPELTHLRVSGISRALSFVDELGNALENAGKSAVSEHRQDEGPSLNDAPLKLPAQLESIYVQYASSSPSPAVSRRPSRSSSRDLTQTISMSGITNDRQGAMIVRLTDLEEKYGARRSITNRTRVQLVVLDPPLDNVIKEAGNRIVRGYAEDTVVRLKEDWLERLNGEDGPWISEAR
ncbi:hypothetical protein AX15_007892 [Amanita polypyramis BW_CC]|nr:hypothetical protein AX15_007892 [Amanita polypyramis BW_CC]